ncbi:hypothetical protein MKW94_001279 [Papaver nudicaule]|uniref:Thioredoxin domain-containing protein n=1 Tax=Papaver nudicaule TaxID=74823 RepID=A0AA42AWG5_PAPNU|nr:hypothetical protein [Papaver nudicaule]
MARNSSSLLRSLFLARYNKTFSSSASIKTQAKSTSSSTTTSGYFSSQMKPSFPFASSSVPLFSSLYFSSATRSFSSYYSPSLRRAPAPQVKMIQSKEEFDSTLRIFDVFGGSAIFYFTAEWCGPCKSLGPIFDKLCYQYHHKVSFYKVDIDEETIQENLEKLNITSVPTFLFFRLGKKTDDILVEADEGKLKEIVERLYGILSY